MLPNFMRLERLSIRRPIRKAIVAQTRMKETPKPERQAMVVAVRLPWLRTETRSTVDYTEVAIEAVTRQAAGGVGNPQALAAVEAAASMCESAFAAARSMPDLPALKPYLLGLMGRAYVLHGELVFLIAVDDAGLALIPCSSWEVAGLRRPASLALPRSPGGAWRLRVSRRPGRGGDSCSLAL